MSEVKLAPPPRRVSGIDMDIAIKKSRYPSRRQLFIGAALVLALAVLAWRIAPQFAANSQSLESSRVTTSLVSSGVFEDFIPLRGVVSPLNTVFLDAVEGGRVEKRLVEDGVLLAVGQPLAVLTNSGLQLEVIRSESEVTNQLNNLRTIEIQLERNKVENERAINEINWQLKRISQKTERDNKLAEIGFIAKANAQDSQDEESYWRNRLSITRQGQITDAQLQTTQVAQLRLATKQLQANLLLARANLDALTVKAPIAGRLTAFEINVGQSLTRGQRLGQIDSPEAAKLLVSIDEYYLSRVAVGQVASLEWENVAYPMSIRKLNPQVRAGQFEGELVFTGLQPKNLRRGQTLQAKLALGESKAAILLPTGPYLTDGGGNFVFLVNGQAAIKQPVQLGRRNVSFVEVLSGLKVGDRVLTSSYTGLLDKERLRITE
jgi:HlyD family secretion protein